MSSLTEMMDQVKSLKSGESIQSLLDESYKILGNPIVMFDTEYKLLAYTNVVTDDPIWNEIVMQGTFSAEMQEFFKNEGFIEAVADAKRVTFLISDKLKYERILGKVFNKNNTHVANLVIVASDRPFGPYDSAVFEAVCSLISRAVNKSEYYQTYENTHQDTLIKNLIEGNYDDRELYAAHVAVLYDDLKAHLYLAAADVSRCDPNYTKPDYFRDLFKQIQPEFKYALYANYIIIIINSDHISLDVNKELSKINKLLIQYNIYAGVSGCFENIYELPKHYTDAVNALNVGVKNKGPYDNQRIFLTDDQTCR